MFDRSLPLPSQLALALCLASCSQHETATSPAAASGLTAVQEQRGPAVTRKTVSTELTGYNHTDKTIGAFYVNGTWGGNITPGSGGGKFVCCVALPDPWQASMTVKLAWEDHELKMQERVVPVPPYDASTVSDLNVHFLRSGEIKVIAFRGGLLHKDYPLKGEQAPLKPGVPLDIRQ